MTDPLTSVCIPTVIPGKTLQKERLIEPSSALRDMILQATKKRAIQS